jgi:hypothetical protein
VVSTSDSNEKSNPISVARINIFEKSLKIYNSKLINPTNSENLYYTDKTILPLKKRKKEKFRVELVNKIFSLLILIYNFNL